jgi:cytochrome b subunit of formate dehydrogenase
MSKTKTTPSGVSSRKVATRKPPARRTAPASYVRFQLSQRIAHILLLTSFTLLGLTGLVQKFAQSGAAQAMIRFLGGIESTRQVHHVAAVVLMLLTIYHAVDIAYKIFVRRVRLTMLPGFKDAWDAWQAFLYNLGIAKSRPQMGRYTFEEKMEYWALIWGTIVMGITGFMMWNPISTTRLLPGEFIPAAKAAHGGEALLAVAAIIIWHMYSVHIKRFNKSMFTGKLSEEEMLHEHPLELADMKAGLAERPVDPQALRRRQRIFWPIAALLVAIMLAGVYAFIGSETTALATAPVPTITVYAPFTPTPQVTPPAQIVLTWDGTIGQTLQAKCGLCHVAGSPSDLSLTTYAEALTGGTEGPVIVPGDSAASRILQVQSSGTHYANLGAEELTWLASWIDQGAPER